MFVEYKEYYSNHYNDFTRPYNGINEVIDYCLSNNIRLGVYTNKVEDIAKDLCEYHFKDKFEFVYGNLETRVRKPDPSFITKVIADLGLNKSEVLYIGDSEVDIQTANNAGIDGLFLSYGYRPKEELLRYSNNILDDALDIINYLK